MIQLVAQEISSTSYHMKEKYGSFVQNLIVVLRLYSLVMYQGRPRAHYWCTRAQHCVCARDLFFAEMHGFLALTWENIVRHSPGALLAHVIVCFADDFMFNFVFTKRTQNQIRQEKYTTHTCPISLISSIFKIRSLGYFSSRQIKFDTPKIRTLAVCLVRK